MKTDVVVIGAGAAGLGAAACARVMGLDVVVLEKAPQFGGTSALSGAVIWVPRRDDADAARYLDALTDPDDRPRRQAFLRHGEEALAFFHAHTDLLYAPRTVAHDYHPEVSGASATGRVLDVQEFDGRNLGERLRDMRAPMPAHLVLGGMMVNRADVQTLLAMARGRLTRRGTGLILRYVRDRLTGWRRGTRLVVGSALVGQLASTLIRQGVPLHLGTQVQRLRVEDGRVTGVDCINGSIDARAVILATGGHPAGQPFSMASPCSDGSGIALATEIGAGMGRAALFRAPVSVRWRDGQEVSRIAHLVLDRAKPGVIAVNTTGSRFTNEADSYHRFAEAIDRLPDKAAWLICDARALRAYGLGLARPAPAHLANRSLIRDGYLIQAPTIADLGRQLDMPDLTATVAAHGTDPDPFGKGASTHNRALGDPDFGPNPCVAPLEQGPFTAVRVHAGILGTAQGLLTDDHARVLRGNQPIVGLYAVGNDMHSIMGGTYPGPGITLGPALVFAWIAATHIAKGEVA